MIYKSTAEFPTRLDYFRYMVRCNFVVYVGQEAEVAPRIERIAAALEAAEVAGNPSSVWHEAAREYGRLDRCNCYPCESARKPAVDCNCAQPGQVQCDLHGPRE